MTKSQALEIVNTPNAIKVFGKEKLSKALEVLKSCGFIQGE